MHARYRVVTKLEHNIQVLEYILQEGADRDVVLIVCTHKQDFLEQLVANIAASSESLPAETPALKDALEDVPPAKELSNPVHSLLQRTLHQLAASENVKLVFCPTITMLRAHISTYRQVAAVSEFQKHRCIMILDLLAVHHGTSEFTLQGLSRTTSSIVAMAYKTGGELLLVECKDALDPTNPHRGAGLWDTQVPLLSGSIRLGEAGQSWAGRQINVRRIIERWLYFESSM